MAKPELTQARLHELLRYDPDTGDFHWRAGNKAYHRAGDVAGCRVQSDCWRIRVDGRYHRAHQLAWLYMTGAWGRPLIDHRDGNPFNNRWDNLRVASHADNAANRRPLPSKAAGLKGVSFDRRVSKWYAQITNQGRRYWLGYFDTSAEAHATYVAKARELFGEFARAE